MLRATLWLAALAWIGGLQAQNIIRGEYFFDLDHGFGSPDNVAFEITDAPSATLTLDPVSVAGLQTGVHTLGIRTLDDSARWSHTNFTTVLVTAPPPSAPDIVEVRYFLNQDPGWDQGTVAWTGSDQDTADVTFTADLSNATEGVNTLFVRSRTTDGRWSHTNHTAVLVTSEPTQGEIDRVEVFNLSDGPDPGFGLAVPFTLDIATTPFSGTLESDLPFVGFGGDDTWDTLAIRSHDTEGHWSHTNFIDSVIVEFSDGVDDLLKTASFSVFPNPFAETLTVQPSEAKPTRVVLYDPAGKKVYDQLLTGSQTVDLAGQASGAYTAFFWQELERIHRVTLIKQ